MPQPAAQKSAPLASARQPALIPHCNRTNSHHSGHIHLPRHPQWRPGWSCPCVMVAAAAAATRVAAGMSASMSPAAAAAGRSSVAAALAAADSAAGVGGRHLTWYGPCPPDQPFIGPMFHTVTLPCKVVFICGLLH